MKMALIIRQVKKKKSQVLESEEIWDPAPLTAIWSYFWQSWVHQSSLIINIFTPSFMRCLWSPNEIINMKAIRKGRLIWVLIVAEALYNTWTQLFLFPCPLWLEGAKCVTVPTGGVPAKLYQPLWETAVRRYGRPTAAGLHLPASALTPSKFLIINWMKTQEYVYQCTAQMKLRIENTEVDRVRIQNDLPRITRWNIIKINIKSCI